MVGKKSGKALLREEGLERTDNNMDLTTWPQVNMINQKNYYTEYLKRDDQILPLRLQQDERRNQMTTTAKDRDRALAQAKPDDLPPPGEPDIDIDDVGMEDANGLLTGQDALGSKVIVIHPGSQNLRIGLASDALPKTVPMVIARKWRLSESEEGRGEPKPKRLKMDDGSELEPEKMFGDDFAKQYVAMCADLKVHMRNNKRRVLPNSKELVVNYNRRTPPETISEHNDPLRIDWTELPNNPKDAPGYFTGKEALRIPDTSNPRYKLFWPLQRGWYNEHDYKEKKTLYDDVAAIIEEAIKQQLNLRRKKDWAQYGCVFIVPDLYERQYVVQSLEMLMRDFGFGKVCFIQESLAATFGAGYTSACVVDIGAQKTSICCVEEGMCIDTSRINLKYGGADVTETFIKMMLFDHFPYSDINLNRRYDFLLAEEIKSKFCTMNEADISVQLFDFHLRASGQDTRKYTFKTYDEVLLAAEGFFQPSIFDNSLKLRGRRKLIPRSQDLYDGSPNDPHSTAQTAVVSLISPSAPSPASLPFGNGEMNGSGANTQGRAPPNLFQRFNDGDRLSASAVGSPVPDDDDTPAPAADSSANNQASNLGHLMRDDVLPIIALDTAILTSIAHGARSDERKTRDFLGGVMVIGGGSQIPGFYSFLEEKLKELRPGFAKDIMIGTPPRELDPQGVVWKGGSVFEFISHVESTQSVEEAGSNHHRADMDEDQGAGKAHEAAEADKADEALREALTEYINRPLSPVQSPSENSEISISELLISPELSFPPVLTEDSTMTAPAPARQERVYHQDYIARIRYENALPPPPGAPKLLDIPIDGLNYYTSAAFASRLAREQPLNIEADAELGMPIDLVGMPGIFDGDESSIQAPHVIPPVHPKDKNLLRPLSELGKPRYAPGGYSFLRRTEYISSEQSRPRLDSSTSKAPIKAPVKLRKQTDTAKDEPVNVLRAAVKGFDIANPKDAYTGSDTKDNIRGAVPSPAELEAWKNPKHPSKPELKVVDTYAIKPDLDAITDSSNYMIAKFASNPTQSTDTRDTRMDVGVLQPMELTQDAEAEFKAKLAAHETDPARNPHPGGPMYSYEFFLPADDNNTAANMKKKLDIDNPNWDDPALTTRKNQNGHGSFRLNHVRTYDTGRQSIMSEHPHKEVALAIYDPTLEEKMAQAGLAETGAATGRLDKAAYYYPIVQKLQLKPRRNKNLAQLGLASRVVDDDENKVDVIDLQIRDPDETEEAKRSGHRLDMENNPEES